MRRQLDVGLLRVLCIGEVLACNFRDGQVFERVLVAAHEREQQVEWPVELRELARECDRNHKASSCLSCAATWAVASIGLAASRAAKAS